MLYVVYIWILIIFYRLPNQVEDMCLELKWPVYNVFDISVITYRICCSIPGMAPIYQIC